MYKSKILGFRSSLTVFAVFITILSTFLISSSCSNDDSSLDTELSQTLRQILIDNMDEFGIPGALVGVWIPGEGSLIIEEGVSDLDSERPISKDDHARIGSITKSYTVTVILQLVDEGTISLVDPLSKYFPDVENSDATIRELANMRSGIFNYTEDRDFVLLLIEDLLRAWTPEELVKVADHNSPYFSPDGGWHYSNTSTVILGMIIEQVTGKFLGDVIQERIVAPLDLKGTTYPTTPDMPVPFTRGYLDLPMGFSDVTFSNPSSSAGSGAMISRLNDMRKWGQALGTGSLLREETQQERIDSLQLIVFSPWLMTTPKERKEIAQSMINTALELVS